ncbi:MAG: hypothetical protein ACI9HK_006123 [Pirellulaceae bacterium]|jgi:hypothetical protein
MNHPPSEIASALYLARLHRAIRDIARSHKLTGDMYTRPTPKVGIHEQQLLYVAVMQDLPAEFRRCDNARRLMKALVFSSEVRRD